MDNAKDDLRELIDTLDEDELLGDKAGTLILALLEESYAEYLVPKIVEIIEENVFDRTTHRKKGDHNLFAEKTYNVESPKGSRHGVP